MSSWGNFSFSELKLLEKSFCWVLLCLLSAFKLWCGCHFLKCRLNHWSLHDCNIYSIPWAGICAFWYWFMVHTGDAESSCSFHYFEQGKDLCYSSSCTPAIQSIWWGIQIWELKESCQIPMSSIYCGKGSSFLGFVPPNDMVNPNLWLALNLMIPVWLADHFVAQLHIYPGVTGNLSTLTHFQLQEWYEDYSFWTRHLQTLSMVLIPSSLTLSEYQSRMHPLMILGPWPHQSLQDCCMQLVPFLIILNCSLLQALNLISYGIRYSFCQYHCRAKCHPPNWFICSSHPVAFGF